MVLPHRHPAHGALANVPLIVSVAKRMNTLVGRMDKNSVDPAAVPLDDDRTVLISPSTGDQTVLFDSDEEILRGDIQSRPGEHLFVFEVMRHKKFAKLLVSVF